MHGGRELITIMEILTPESLKHRKLSKHAGSIPTFDPALIIVKTTDPRQNKGHTQTESEGLEEDT